MKRILLVTCALIILGLAGLVPAQKLDTSRPSVYITFKNFLKQTPDPAHPTEGATLLVHNNTRWPISYTESYDSTVAGGQVVYLIQRDDGHIDPSTAAHVIFTRKLMPGKTFSFVVPRRNLSKGNEIDVEFSFSWEFHHGDSIRGEVVHRAYFLATDLPRWPE